MVSPIDPIDTNNHTTQMDGTKTVKVWDFPTRIFHGAVAFFVLVAWASSEADGSILWVHVYSGILLFGLIAFRMVWGVIGSRYARFRDFVHGREVVTDYSKRLLAFQPPHSTGHNPLGGWMVMALLATIFFAVLTGLMINKSGFVGPLSNIAGGIFGKTHEGFANLLLFLIFGHIAGVFIHGFITRENLPRAMITGMKEIPQDVLAEDIKPVGYVRPFIALAIAVAVVLFFMP